MRRLESWTTTPARLLVALLVLFGVVLGCAVLAGELLELVERPDGSTGFDSSITTWVTARRADGLTTIAKLLSTVGSQTVLIPVTAIVAVLLFRRREFVTGAMLVALWGGALGLYSLAKLFVHRQRPPSEIWLTKVAGTAFPSGHAVQSLATFVALAVAGAVWVPRARGAVLALAVVLAAGVGCSRVYLGVHWTTDVLAGWLIGAAWIAIVLRLTRPAAAIGARLRTGAAPGT
ncbi:MAG TPA: phosphatase PAP2 family protein [Solirubrobacteraceae bacterium]